LKDHVLDWWMVQAQVILNLFTMLMWKQFKSQLNERFTLPHQVLQDDVEFLELQQSKGHMSLAKYVQEFNTKLTFVPIKKELSKNLIFLQGL
jgi:hypothetical protein